jgi:hypothetical protein
MKRLGVLAAVASLTVLLVNVGSAEGATVRQLQAKALTISNFPTGWAVDNSSDSSTGSSGCLSGLKSRFKHEVKVTAQFVNGGNLPALQETLETGPGISGRYGKFVKTLNNCKTLAYSANGAQVKGTIGAMSFPTVGNRSAAYAITLKVEGETAGVDLVIFQVGSLIGDVVYEDFVPDTDQVQAFVNEAINKIEGKKAVTPTTF